MPLRSALRHPHRQKCDRKATVFGRGKFFGNHATCFEIALDYGSRGRIGDRSGKPVRPAPGVSSGRWIDWRHQPAALGRADEVSNFLRLNSTFRGRRKMWAWLFGGGHWRWTSTD